MLHHASSARVFRLAPLVALALSAAACGDSETTTAAVPVFVEASAARVRPGEATDVTLRVTNAGQGRWKAGALTASPVTSGWTGTLSLSSPVAAGAAGVLTGQLTTPMREGIHRVELRVRSGGKEVGSLMAVVVDVTCADAIFCNGTERLVAGACASGNAPCDDGVACTVDSCDEAKGACSHALGAECASCQGDCEPACEGKACGDDGCGGVCATCGAGQACAEVSGACADDDMPGSCRSPLPLVPGGASLVGDHVIAGDSTDGINETIPVCNRTSKSVERVYTFTTTTTMGIEARATGYDTVLHLRREDPNTPTNDCLDNSPAATVKCSDDASPPGDYGSRIAAKLTPGTYYLVVDGFDSSQYGPYELQVRLTADGCIPVCDGVYCGGDDGCGGDCGACGDGLECKAGRCYPDPCTPTCDGRDCGPDGCGGTCGQCSGGALCVEAEGRCDTFPSCDHLVPTCGAGCGAGMFCGTDCECHRVDARLPDLIVNRERLASEIEMDEVVVRETSCAWIENCVGGLGARKVLRFSVEAVNQGQADMLPPPVEERPDMFHFSPCHGHYHYDGFASYALLDASGQVVVRGRKQAYCMEDTAQYLLGPEIECGKVHDCSTQGISHGWSDLYGNALDCQWIDVTGIAPGAYTIRVELNPTRAFQEVSFDNNTAEVGVVIE